MLVLSVTQVVPAARQAAYLSGPTAFSTVQTVWLRVFPGSSTLRPERPQTAPNV